jgi:hypothetical protein
MPNRQTTQTSGKQQWVEVGKPFFHRMAPNFVSFAMDSSGTPYIAYYVNYFNNHRVAVIKYTNENWAQVGSADFATDQVKELSLAIDPRGFPFIAYGDRQKSGKVMVMMYNGKSWVDIAKSGVSSGGASRITLVLDSNGKPYVAYEDHAIGYKLAVMKFTGESWIEVGKAGFSAANPRSLCLAFDPNDTAYVAYQDSDNNRRVTVMKYAENRWITIGSAGFPVRKPGYPNKIEDVCLAIDSRGVPYVAFQDCSDENRAAVMMYNGDTWVDVGKPGFSAGGVTDISLAIDSNGMPYIAYRNERFENIYGEASQLENDMQATVMKYENDRWSVVGIEAFPPRHTSNISIRINPSDTPYVAFVTAERDHPVMVMAFK